MENSSYRIHPTILKYTLLGFGFGTLFPVIGFAVDNMMRPVTETHTLGSLFISNPLHWIILTAPIILGTVFHIIGKQRAALENKVTELQQFTLSLEKEIQERKQAEDALNEQAHLLNERAEKLEAANQELDQFAYIVSHDLKAPLRGIDNLADWIREEVEMLDEMPEELDEYTTLMRKRVNRMRDMISGILTYSRAGRRLDKIVPINVGEVVHEIVDSMHIADTITVTIAQDLPEITGEKVKIDQVFSNFISNAIKYHDRPDGNIGVNWHDLGDKFRFDVTDDGPGIEPQYHDKIFAVFQTLQARDKVESTGIGLAVVKKIIQEYGGDVGIESVAGEGSTFFFTWPKVITLTEVDGLGEENEQQN